MKLSRKLVPAIAMLLVSAVMLSTASFAWFSMNTTVEAKGMQVTAQAMGSLVITKDAAPTASTNTDEVTFGAAGFDIADATHDAAQFADGGTYTSGLKTVTDRSKVDIDDGTYDDANGYTPVAKYVSGDHYYVDYGVFIAAKNGTLDNMDLKVQLSNATGPAYADAVEVDFYVFTDVTAAADPTAAAFKVTVEEGGATATTLLENVTIPEAGQKAIYIVMRVFIDGSEEAVMNTNWGATAASFDATFTVSAHS